MRSNKEGSLSVVKVQKTVRKNIKGMNEGSEGTLLGGDFLIYSPFASDKCH